MPPGSTAASPHLTEIEAELLATGVPVSDRRFDLTWHDWLNLRSLVEASAVIARAAKSTGEFARRAFPCRLPRARAISRSSRFTVARSSRAARSQSRDAPVRFTHVRPGETLLGAAAE